MNAVGVRPAHAPARRTHAFSCRTVARVLAVVLALAAAHAAAPDARAAALASVGGGAGAHIAWSGARDSLAPGLPDTSAAARARWRARAADPALAPLALHVLGEARLAVGDTAGADSCWRAAPTARGPWAWESLQRAAALALARSGPAAADALLEPVERSAWSDAERASWLERRARLALARRDTADATEFARQLVLAYPGVAGPASRGFLLLDSLAAARGDSVKLDELRAAAEGDAFRGARPAAIAKARRVLARAPRTARFAAAMRLAEFLRTARMPVAAGAAADTAVAYADDASERARARLERARAWRDAGRTDSALVAYARVGDGTADATVRGTAWWEYAREAEDRMRYREAYAGFVRVVQRGGAKADDACFRAGLMQLAFGERDSAAVWWRRAHGENARFWLAIALRSSDRAASDSLLGALASAPGYGFYRAAARETLGVRGWPASGAPVAPASDDALALAPALRALVADGRDAEAAELLGRWSSGDARTGAVRAPGVPALVAATALAFDLGRPALGTRIAERAFAAAASDSEAWAIVPWAYPPAWKDGVVRAESLGVERALLWALVRQESRFEPRARSRSDALGLTQLKQAAAGDMAKLLREPAPTEARLFQPDVALRYGALYLARLLKRFDGCVPVALAAYNAGPSTVRADWRALLAAGGEALYCELASNADSQDYARRIVGFRQAYRELSPDRAEP